MKRKYKLNYLVYSYSTPGAWWDYELKKWVLSDDMRKIHKGYSSSRSCRTIKSAIRSSRQLQALVKDEVLICRISWRKGKRLMQEFSLREDPC